MICRASFVRFRCGIDFPVSHESCRWHRTHVSGQSFLLRFTCVGSRAPRPRVHPSLDGARVVCSCASCSSFLTSWVKFPPIMVRLAFPPSPPLPFGDPLPNPAMPIPLSPSPSHPLLVGISRWVHPVWVGVAPGSSLIFHLDGTHGPDPTEMDTERREGWRKSERGMERGERETHTHTHRERGREIERD